MKAEISLVICDREEKAAALLENKEQGATPSLSCLVLFSDASAALVERGQRCGVEILQLTQIMVGPGAQRDRGDPGETLVGPGAGETLSWRSVDESRHELVTLLLILFSGTWKTEPAGSDCEWIFRQCLLPSLLPNHGKHVYYCTKRIGWHKYLKMIRL